MIQLSKRLQAVASLVTEQGTLADVGTDHGYIPIFLTECKKIKRAIAMDVNQGPLLRAREHILQYGLEEQIETRLSDGLKALSPGEAEAIVIAGMGGSLMMRILTMGEPVARAAKELVLQPQSEIAAFREFLSRNHYQLVSEDMVFEDGKYYPMMRVKPLHSSEAVPEDMAERSCCARLGMDDMPGSLNSGSVEFQHIAYKYGPLLLQQKHPVLRQYLLYQQKQKQKILDSLQKNAKQNVESRIGEVITELEELELALEMVSFL